MDLQEQLASQVQEERRQLVNLFAEVTERISAQMTEEDLENLSRCFDGAYSLPRDSIRHAIKKLAPIFDAIMAGPFDAEKKVYFALNAAKAVEAIRVVDAIKTPGDLPRNPYLDAFTGQALDLAFAAAKEMPEADDNTVNAMLSILHRYQHFIERPPEERNEKQAAILNELVTFAQTFVENRDYSGAMSTLLSCACRMPYESNEDVTDLVSVLNKVLDLMPQMIKENYCIALGYLTRDHGSVLGTFHRFLHDREEYKLVVVRALEFAMPIHDANIAEYDQATGFGADLNIYKNAAFGLGSFMPYAPPEVRATISGKYYSYASDKYFDPYDRLKILLDQFRYEAGGLREDALKRIVEEVAKAKLLKFSSPSNCPEILINVVQAVDSENGKTLLKAFKPLGENQDNWKQAIAKEERRIAAKEQQQEASR